MLVLFFQRLMNSVRSILAAVSDLTFDKAAEISVHISEVTPSLAVTLIMSRSNEQATEEKLLKEIEN